MKFFYSIPFFLLLFTGCLYFNDSGISTHLYDNCKEYYDNCGNYHKECPKNLIDYSQMGINGDDKKERSECREP